MVLCFFFQGEDGIRDDLVTGVQTCALPISNPSTPIATQRHASTAAILKRSFLPARGIRTRRTRSEKVVRVCATTRGEIAVPLAKSRPVKTALPRVADADQQKAAPAIRT